CASDRSSALADSRLLAPASRNSRRSPRSIPWSVPKVPSPVLSLREPAPTAAGGLIAPPPRPSGSFRRAPAAGGFAPAAPRAARRVKRGMAGWQALLGRRQRQRRQVDRLAE